MVEVCFQYDEKLRTWEVIMEGCKTELEARQAFNAVIIMASMATPKLSHNRAEELPDGSFKIIVGV